MVITLKWHFWGTVLDVVKIGTGNATGYVIKKSRRRM